MHVALLHTAIREANVTYIMCLGPSQLASCHCCEWISFGLSGAGAQKYRRQVTRAKPRALISTSLLPVQQYIAAGKIVSCTLPCYDCQTIERSHFLASVGISRSLSLKKKQLTCFKHAPKNISLAHKMQLSTCCSFVFHFFSLVTLNQRSQQICRVRAPIRGHTKRFSP